MKPKGSGLLPVRTSVRAKMPIPLGPPDQSPASDEELATGREPPHAHRASAGRPVGIENQEPMANSGPPLSDTSIILRTHIVEKGDSLSMIILQTYGRYDRDLLSAVLRHNPEIHNPGLILAGQVIKLPEKKL